MQNALFSPENLKLAIKNWKGGHTYLDLALAVGVTERTVKRWVAGQKPPLERLKRLASTLNVDIEVLEGLQPPPKSPTAGVEFPSQKARQMNVVLSTAAHLQYQLIAERYGINRTELAEIAPLLFGVIAESALAWRREMAISTPDHSRDGTWDETLDDVFSRAQVDGYDRRQLVSPAEDQEGEGPVGAGNTLLNSFLRELLNRHGVEDRVSIGQRSAGQKFPPYQICEDWMTVLIGLPPQSGGNWARNQMRCGANDVSLEILKKRGLLDPTDLFWKWEERKAYLSALYEAKPKVDPNPALDYGNCQLAIDNYHAELVAKQKQYADWLAGLSDEERARWDKEMADRRTELRQQQKQIERVRQERRDELRRREKAYELANTARLMTSAIEAIENANQIFPELRQTLRNHPAWQRWEAGGRDFITLKTLFDSIPERTRMGLELSSAEVD